MDFTNINHLKRVLANLPWTSAIFLSVLAILAVGGACVGIYVGIRMAVDARRVRRERRLRRKARLAQRGALQASK
jgi:hypothetical protein